jgi:hypothetical protein
MLMILLGEQKVLPVKNKTLLDSKNKNLTLLVGGL